MMGGMGSTGQRKRRGVARASGPRFDGIAGQPARSGRRTRRRTPACPRGGSSASSGIEAQTQAWEQRPLLQGLGRSDGVLRPVPTGRHFLRIRGTHPPSPGPAQVRFATPAPGIFMVPGTADASSRYDQPPSTSTVGPRQTRAHAGTAAAAAAAAVTLIAAAAAAAAAADVSVV